MARTEIDGTQILDGSVQKKDIDITTAGEAVITSFAVTGSGFTYTYTGADPGTGTVTLELVAGGFGTEYYEFQSTPEQSTTSNNWVTAATFSTPSIDAGKYIVHYKAQLTNSQNKVVGFQVRSDSGSGYVTIEESITAPTKSGDFETRAAFEEVELPVDGVIDIQVRYGQTDAGGIGRIKDIAVYIFKVGDL